jgi:hypothetical protein
MASPRRFEQGTPEKVGRKTMHNLQFSVEYAKMINREHREKAAKHQLLRQIEPDRPRVLNHLGLQIGELVMALALALRLR